MAVTEYKCFTLGILDKVQTWGWWHDSILLFQKWAYYTDTNRHGSFACKRRRTKNGKIKCKLVRQNTVLHFVFDFHVYVYYFVKWITFHSLHDDPLHGYISTKFRIKYRNLVNTLVISKHIALLLKGQPANHCFLNKSYNHNYWRHNVRHITVEAFLSIQCELKWMEVFSRPLSFQLYEYVHAGVWIFIKLFCLVSHFFRPSSWTLQSFGFSPFNYSLIVTNYSYALGNSLKYLMGYSVLYFVHLKMKQSMQAKKQQEKRK